MRFQNHLTLKSALGILFLSLFTQCTSKIPPSLSGIVSIQAFTDLSFYGQKLERVEVIYQENVATESLTAESFQLLDRGYASPDFIPVQIDHIEKDGQKITLIITQDTEASPNNTLEYRGDNATGSRTKNPAGLYATGPWYRAVNGDIYFGESDTLEYKPNTSRDGYQTRSSLELKLFHTQETEEESAKLANTDGTYYDAGLWLPTVDKGYGPGEFQSFEDLGIQVPTTATDGEAYVRGWAYFPEGYDKNNSEKYPLIITITGYGTSFWRHEDGTHNFGTGLNFDGSGFRWRDSGAIVLNIHDRSHTGGDAYKFYEDDYNVIQYFIANFNADANNITLTGNSRGTIAINTIAATYPGLVRTLILNNGFFGAGLPGKNMFEGMWTAAEWEALAAQGVRVWIFDGEKDTDNQENFEKAKIYYAHAGHTEDWIDENLRITAFPTHLYHYWGETDHSTTKMTYWYFYDQPYFGPHAHIEKGQLVYDHKLNPNDTYELQGWLNEGDYSKAGYPFKIYPESLKEWVLK